MYPDIVVRKYNGTSWDIEKVFSHSNYSLTSPYSFGSSLCMNNDGSMLIIGCDSSNKIFIMNEAVS